MDPKIIGGIRNIRNILALILLARIFFFDHSGRFFWSAAGLTTNIGYLLHKPFLVAVCLPTVSPSIMMPMLVVLNNHEDYRPLKKNLTPKFDPEPVTISFEIYITIIARHDRYKE